MFNSSDYVSKTATSSRSLETTSIFASSSTSSTPLSTSSTASTASATASAISTTSVTSTSSTLSMAPTASAASTLSTPSPSSTPMPPTSFPHAVITSSATSNSITSTTSSSSLRGTQVLASPSRTASSSTSVSIGHTSSQAQETHGSSIPLAGSSHSSPTPTRKHKAVHLASSRQPFDVGVGSDPTPDTQSPATIINEALSETTNTYATSIAVLIPTSTITVQATSLPGVTPTELPFSTLTSSTISFSTPTLTLQPVAHHATTSRRPVIIIGAMFGAIILIACVAAITTSIRKRLQNGRSFLWWHGNVQQDMIEELGFGSEYDQFGASTEQQNKEISRLHDANPAIAVGQTIPAGISMPAHDDPYRYPAASYTQGETMCPAHRPWSPLHPRRVSQSAPAELRMSRRSTLRLDSQEVDIADIKFDAPPVSVAQYYASQESVKPKAYFSNQDPFTDSAQSAHNNSYTGTHALDVATDPHSPRIIETAMSMYSTSSTSLNLPVEKTSEPAATSRPSIAHISGFRVESESESEYEGDKYRWSVRSRLARTQSHVSFASSLGASGGEDDHTVLAALRDRKKHLAAGSTESIDVKDS